MTFGKSEFNVETLTVPGRLRAVKSILFIQIRSF